MPCDTIRNPQQTIAQRADEVRRAVARLSTALATGRASVKVGPQGAVVFVGWDAAERDGITDACAYRKLMVMGSAIARSKIAFAEQLAGRSVDKRVIGQGVHSHDGGQTWHSKG